MQREIGELTCTLCRIVKSDFTQSNPKIFVQLLPSVARRGSPRPTLLYQFSQEGDDCWLWKRMSSVGCSDVKTSSIGNISVPGWKETQSLSSDGTAVTRILPEDRVRLVPVPILLLIMHCAECEQLRRGHAQLELSEHTSKRLVWGIQSHWRIYLWPWLIWFGHWYLRCSRQIGA